jgi:hypothetical protein
MEWISAFPFKFHPVARRGLWCLRAVTLRTSCTAPPVKKELLRLLLQFSSPTQASQIFWNGIAVGGLQTSDGIFFCTPFGAPVAIGAQCGWKFSNGPNFNGSTGIVSSLGPPLVFSSPGATDSLYTLIPVWDTPPGALDPGIHGFQIVGSAENCLGGCLPWVDGQVHSLGTLNGDTFDVQFAAVDEPSTIALVTTGISFFGFAVWRRRREQLQA